MKKKTPIKKKNPGAFREVPYMGVIWVVAEAMKRGFYNGNPEWSNLGQGQPEIGEMEGAPPRILQFTIDPGDQAYGPLSGSQQVREKIAAHYNRLYRRDHASKYTADNVSVCMGGRLALTRVFAALGKIRLGYKNPDYTAYEDMMNYHPGKITPVEIPVARENNFDIPALELEKTIRKYRLSALLLSNPCNPTGTVISEADLKNYVKSAKRTGCTMIFDEFYSHFIYNGKDPGNGPVSAAEYIDDVNRSPVILIDGLTKSFRYPGWRVGWIVGPVSIIENINRAASAIDGGPSQPMMRAALNVLEENYADRETSALRKVFSAKRNIMMDMLSREGIEFLDSRGTFYLWGNISGLSKRINTAEKFFYEALKYKTMTVPGYFFNVRAGKSKLRKRAFDQWVRFSFGPPEKNMIQGLDRLVNMIRK